MVGIPKIDFSKGKTKLLRMPCGHYLNNGTEMFTAESKDIHSVLCTICGIKHLMDNLGPIPIKIVKWEPSDPCGCCGEEL